MKAAVKRAADFLNSAGKVVLVVGSQIKKGKAIQQTLDLANACDYPVAVMPRSKGLFPETHPKYALSKFDVLLVHPANTERIAGSFTVLSAHRSGC